MRKGVGESSFGRENRGRGGYIYPPSPDTLRDTLADQTQDSRAHKYYHNDSGSTDQSYPFSSHTHNNLENGVLLQLLRLLLLRQRRHLQMRAGLWVQQLPCK